MGKRYFSADEAGQFPYFRIPKALLSRPVSVEAKFLYGLLLDRLGLSAKNGWVDAGPDGGSRVYLYFTVQAVAEALSCGHGKAIRLFQELEDAGLIERGRQGCGHPSKIYVLDFMREDAVPDAVKSEYGTPETTEIQSPEVLKADAGTSENGSSESPESEPFEVSKPDANKNEGNKSEISKPDFIKLYPSSVPAPTEDGIREQLEYDVLLERRPERKARYDKIVALIADTLLSRADTVRINGADVPKARVAERFGELDFEHIEYVLDRMDESPTAIRSIRAWLLTALYNAPVTFDSYMNARVLRDMPWLAGA